MAISWKTGEKNGTVEFVGCVLTGIYDRYCGFDYYSDYADVWDGEKVVAINVGSGYCTMSDRYADVTIDATPEVKELVENWQEAEYARKGRISQANSVIKEKDLIRRGEKITIVKGRKHVVGTVGIVFWVGDTKYGRSVGFKTEGDDTAKWVAFGNVEKVLNEIEIAEVKAAEEMIKANGILALV